MRLAWGLALSLAMGTAAHAAPKLPPVDDVMAECAFSASTELCEANAKSFGEDWPKAYKKDYQAQRNVAFCLTSGCDGAVRINKPLGCAWRVVILASGSNKIDDSDRTNYEWVCVGKLTAGEAIVSQSSAAEIYRTIYRRELPMP